MRWKVWRRKLLCRSRHTAARGVFSLLLAAAALLLAVQILELRLRPVVLTLAEAQLQNRITAVTERVLAQQTEDAPLLSVQRDAEGRIQSGTVDMAAANRLRSRVLSELLAQLQDQVYPVSVPLGSLLHADALWAKGPSFSVDTLAAGTVSAQIRSDLNSAGVNQTRYQVWLECSVPLVILLPGNRQTTTVETRFCLAETLIVGPVPDAYLAPQSQQPGA